MNPSGLTQLPSLDRTLREHRNRIRNVEQPLGGQWVYVLPIAPAAVPDDYIANPYSPTFLNGTLNVAGAQPVSFRIHPVTRLVLRGGVDFSSTLPPLVIFTLPAGFRPTNAAPVLFPSTDGTFVWTGRVDPTGDVWILGGVATV